MKKAGRLALALRSRWRAAAADGDDGGERRRSSSIRAARRSSSRRSSSASRRRRASTSTCATPTAPSSRRRSRRRAATRPADVFFAQDPGSLGAVEDQLAELPEDVLDRVDERFRDDEGRWVGTSGRARVIVYNTDELTEDEVPDSVFDLTDPKWKGKIGIAPTNASFQAFVTAMRLDAGEERTRQWLEDLKANDPKFYERNTPVVEAVASGEIEVGLVNHYYLYLVKEERPGRADREQVPAGRRPGRARQRRRRRRARERGACRRRRAVRRVPARGRAAALLHRRGRGGRDPARRRDRAEGGRADARRALGPRPGRRPLLVRRASSRGRSSC